jgi:hypothetical protein
VSHKSLPSTKTFVITARSAKAATELPKLAASLGETECLGGHERRFTLTLKSPPPDPEEGLRLVREALGSRYEVQHVLLDEQGHPHFPTGTLTVRFKTAPSDKELREFAGPLGLTVESRNDFIPSQVSFRVSPRKKASVPDVLERIQAGEDRVQEAWPETLASYHRE